MLGKEVRGGCVGVWGVGRIQHSNRKLAEHAGVQLRSVFEKMREYARSSARGHYPVALPSVFEAFRAFAADVLGFGHSHEATTHKQTFHNICGNAGLYYVPHVSSENRRMGGVETHYRPPGQVSSRVVALVSPRFAHFRPEAPRIKCFPCSRPIAPTAGCYDRRRTSWLDVFLMTELLNPPSTELHASLAI